MFCCINWCLILSFVQASSNHIIKSSDNSHKRLGYRCLISVWPIISVLKCFAVFPWHWLYQHYIVVRKLGALQIVICNIWCFWNCYCLWKPFLSVIVISGWRHVYVHKVACFPVAAAKVKWHEQGVRILAKEILDGKRTEPWTVYPCTLQHQEYFKSNVMFWNKCLNGQLLAFASFLFYCGLCKFLCKMFNLHPDTECGCC